MAPTIVPEDWPPSLYHVMALGTQGATSAHSKATESLQTAALSWGHRNATGQLEEM